MSMSFCTSTWYCSWYADSGVAGRPLARTAPLRFLMSNPASLDSKAAVSPSTGRAKVQRMALPMASAVVSVH